MFQRLRTVDSIAILRRQTTLYGPARHGWLAHTHSYGLCTKAVRNRNGAGEEFTAGLSAAVSRLLLKATACTHCGHCAAELTGYYSLLLWLLPLGTARWLVSCVSIRLLLTAHGWLPRSRMGSTMGRNRFSFESSLADRLRQMERR